MEKHAAISLLNDKLKVVWLCRKRCGRRLEEALRRIEQGEITESSTAGGSEM